MNPEALKEYLSHQLNLPSGQEFEPYKNPHIIRVSRQPNFGLFVCFGDDHRNYTVVFCPFSRFDFLDNNIHRRTFARIILETLGEYYQSTSQK